MAQTLLSNTETTSDLLLICGPLTDHNVQLEPLDDGWYYTYVPRFVQNIIVNASEASVQTEGIAVEAGKAVWITVADDATASVSYEAQSMAEIPEYVEKFTVHAYVPLHDIQFPDGTVQKRFPDGKYSG